MPRRPVHIANFSGYLGDRPDALTEVLSSSDRIDVLVGDYLAEVTLAALAGDLQNPDSKRRGYVGYFVRQIEPHLAVLSERGIKVVTNAGGFDPSGLAKVLRTKIADLGLALQVAHVEGDDLLAKLDDLQANGHELSNLDTSKPLSSWEHEPISANAYLGGWGIAAALEGGADIVITGRVTDASLSSGPASWWHQWSSDDWGALAGAVTAAHVIECGGHATGGNFSGFTGVPSFLWPGYPVAEVAADGSCVITKLSGQDGTVTVDTVTAQLVYEIQGPRYLNPDVTVHLDSVTLEQLGTDRVRIGPVRGSAPPPTAKVAIFAPIGYQLSQMVFMTAPHVEEKTRLLRAQLIDALGSDLLDLDVVRFGAPVEDPASQAEATVAVRVMATSKDPAPLQRLVRLIDSLYLSSFPGYHLDSAAPRCAGPSARIEYWPALLDFGEVDHRAIMADGTVVHPEVPPRADEPSAVPDDPGQTNVWAGRSVPLGTLAHARSGDKGGNVNVGVWVSNPAAWEWLRTTLTTETFRRLISETKELSLVRHELPHLRAVHFVVKGLLGSGGSSNLRVDQVGKSFGEYLLAKHTTIPEELVNA